MCGWKLGLFYFAQPIAIRHRPHGGALEFLQAGVDFSGLPGDRGTPGTAWQMSVPEQFGNGQSAARFLQRLPSRR